jgi:PPOX class probable F420-dependent enzyme
MTGIVEIE